MKRLLAPFSLIFGLIAGCLGLLGQNTSINQLGPITNTISAPADVTVQLSGQNSCSLTTTGPATFSVQPRSSNDNQNWTNIGSAIVSNATTTVAVNSSSQGIAYFQAHFTAVSGGPLTYTVVCNSSGGGGSGGGGTSTFPPYPWIVQPTNVPTLNVNCVSGGCPTPIPFPSSYFNFSPAPNGAAILGVVPVSPSGTPWPLNAGNQPIVQVSALPAAGPTSTPGNVPLVTDVQANASPQPTAASGIRKTVTCDPTTGTQCATVTSGGALVTTGFQNSSGVVVATICDKFASVAISSQTTTELVAASGSTAVYLCGAVVGYNGTTTTATLNFKYGTKTTNPCDTGAVSITGAIGIGTGTAATLPVSVMPFNTMAYYATPASQELCATTVGTNSITVLVSYAQH